MLIDYKYKCDTHDQFILVNEDGFVLDTDSSLLSDTIGKPISSVHPFFESLSFLQQHTDDTYDFSAVHISINEIAFIFDITFRTFKNDSNKLIILNNFTNLYGEYYAMSQNRNDSIISKEVINLKNDLLIKKEKYKNRFLTNFSHILKTPIHNLKGFSNLLEQTDLDLVQRHQLKVIQSTSDELYAMISNILDISRINTGYFYIQNNRFNIHDLFNKLTSIYKMKCAEKRLEFNGILDKTIPNFVVGDKYRLEQILNNILENAFKFTQQGGVIFSISGKKTKNGITIIFKIKDTGIGIIEEEQDKIFGSFYKIEKDKYKKSPGLGLALAFQLVELMNGEIIVKSQENEGSTFTIELSFKIADNQIKPEIKPLPLKSKKATVKYRILVAEALETDQHRIKEIFNNSTDFQMDLVERGDDVITKLQKYQYDLLLLNIRIPTMDGYDTTRFIRYSEVNNFNHIPIIAVGSSYSKDEKEHCLDKGMNDYISKPYDSDELKKKIRQLLKNQKKKKKIK